MILFSKFNDVFYKVFVALSISVLVWITFKHHHDSINTQDLIKFRKEVNSAIYPITSDTTFVSGGVFLYSDNYSRVNYLFGKNLPPFIDETLNEEVRIDPVITTSLNFHKQHSCYVVPTTDLPKDSYLYNAIDNTSSISTNNDYISCPIFLEKTLVGYFAVVVQNVEDVFLKAYRIEFTSNSISNQLLELLKEQ